MFYQTISASQSVSATGGGADVDLSGFTRKVRVLFNSFNTAGSSPTHARKLQASAALTRGLEQSTAGDNDNGLLTGASTNVRLALKFTQSGAKQVKRVALQLKNNGSIAAGKKLTLAIQSDSTGAPSGTAVTNGTAGTVLCSAVAASYGWVVFTFANPVDLADATVYHLVLTADYSASASNYISWRDLTVATGGTLNTYDGSAWAGVSDTHALEVYVDQYSFADVAGATQTQTTGTVVVNESIEINVDDLAAPIVRVYDTIGGTSSPAFVASCSLVGEAKTLV